VSAQMASAALAAHSIRLLVFIHSLSGLYYWSQLGIVNGILQLMLQLKAEITLSSVISK